MSDPEPSAEAGEPTGASSPSAWMRFLSALPGRRDDVVAIVNGLFGDELNDRDAQFATPMTMRIASANGGSTALPADPVELAATLDRSGVAVTSKLCILVHGLMSNESIWRMPDMGAEPQNYGSLLAAEHGMTPLAVRYNTGRHISTNGRELARLIDQLVRAWPVPVREVNLIGHSMGGLVVRAACHYGLGSRPGWWHRRWTSKLRRVVLIGVPNVGAPLEGFVNALSAALGSLPVAPTRLLGTGLNRRSRGIKDLRIGAVVDEDWREREPGDLAPAHALVRRPRGTRFLIVAGSVTANSEHLVARVIGDAMVTEASATGRRHVDSGGDLFPEADHLMFPKITHNALARHPTVHLAIANWW
ncbi:MAG TPA: alpha/beta fold hydrolase [Ilumatobacter sp.]|nr:alpha/beta fold hydrolase [Ilumatobacter sp.]